MKHFKESDVLTRVLGIAALIAIIFSAVFIKEGDVARSSGAQNLEATYHTLLTIESLRQNKITDHWLLPTVTLGGEGDNFVPWGATVPTASGDFIYTSFTSPGFLLPYAVFELFDMAPTISNLARFNMAVGAIAGIILYFLILQIATFSGYKPPAATLAALVGIAIAFFSRESLLSTGVIYWPHSLYQILFLASLLLLFKMLITDAINNGQKQTPNLLLSLLFVGAWVEWAGYIFNFGLFLIFWFLKGDKLSRVFSIKVMIVTILAGIFTIAHFGFVVGFGDAIQAIAARFFTRDVSSGNLESLIGGYGLSYGLFLLIVLAIVLQDYIFKGKISVSNQIISLILFAAVFPLFANIILLQHATQFSFDRLKFIAPAGLIIGIAFLQGKMKYRILLLGLVFLASIHGHKTHTSNMKQYSEWASHNSANRVLVERLKQQVDFRWATFSSNLGVRGYANLLVGRSIYEHKLPEQAIQLNQNRNGSASVYLEGYFVYTDLPRYSRATVTWPDGRTVVLNNEEAQ